MRPCGRQGKQCFNNAAFQRIWNSPKRYRDNQRQNEQKQNSFAENWKLNHEGKAVFLILYISYMTMQFETKVVNGQIPVPAQYIEKLSSQVKVIIVSLHEKSEGKVFAKQPADDGFGSLSKYANPELLAKENSAWELAMREKYDSR
jgi:hypothetical protein